VSWHDDAYAAATGADLVVFLTEWNEFRGLDLKKLAAVMAQPVMADLRNIYTADSARSAGFTSYVSVGPPDDT
ncbi:UDP binding domain-containing protein, partial [uncultured Roseovarius sp.]|uniref:UDP binding domain-containing protein n=1 Tax=uncultured Roseovarius sp. TaxID=293344 RepID=UPI0025F3060E